VTGNADIAAGSGEAADMVPRGGVGGFFLMVLGMFMAILDIQIVAASLPQIQAGVSASIDEVTWVQTAYLIAEVVMIPMSGWLSKIMSTRWLFMASSLGFTMMSLACALSWNVTSLIVFRALQGFLGGAMIPTVFAANFKLFPPEKQMLGTVVIGLTATVAPSIGPTLGGYLTELFSWHWLFLANILPGIFVSIAVPMFVDIDRPNWSLARKIDLPGIVLIAGFLGSLELVLDEGPREGWFESRMILLFTVVSVVSAILLLWREMTAENPVLELHAFKNRNFAVGCILTFVLGICLYGQSYILPQVLARVRHLNSLQIGDIMWVTGVAMFLSAPIVGRLSAVVDPRRILTVGFVVVAFGLYLNARMTDQVGFQELLWAQIVRGAGLVMCIVPITSAALGTLPKELVSGGSGLFNVFRNMGGAMGLSAINTQWSGRFDRHYLDLSSHLSSTSQVVAERLDALSAYFSHATVTTASAPDQLALGLLARQMAQQANIMAWNDIFFMLALAFLLSIPLIFLLARPKATQIAAH